MLVVLWFLSGLAALAVSAIALALELEDDEIKSVPVGGIIVCAILMILGGPGSWAVAARFIPDIGRK